MTIINPTIFPGKKLQINGESDKRGYAAQDLKAFDLVRTTTNAWIFKLDGPISSSHTIGYIRQNCDYSEERDEIPYKEILAISDEATRIPTADCYAFFKSCRIDGNQFTIDFKLFNDNHFDVKLNLIVQYDGDRIQPTTQASFSESGSEGQQLNLPVLLRPFQDTDNFSVSFQCVEDEFSPDGYPFSLELHSTDGQMLFHDEYEATLNTITRKGAEM